MTLFAALFQDARASAADFRDIVDDLARRGRVAKVQSTGRGLARAISWQAPKAIPDILIEGDKCDSWLMAVGTPLPSKRLQAENGRQGFLDDLLKDPVKAVPKYLDGAFALLAYDARSQRFIVASDFNRTVPLFCAVTSTGAYFCGSELALARMLGAEIDPEGFAQTIHLGTPCGTQTRFRGISMIAPASVMIVDANLNKTETPYWRPGDETPWTGSFDQVLDRWSTLVADAVGRYDSFGAEGSTLTDLTAGEDSRLVLAQCRALGLGCTAHVAGFDNDLDVTVAARAAKDVGFPITVTPYQLIAPAQLKAHAQDIALATDGYANIFKACIRFATREGIRLEGLVRLCGMPGGEAFRGANNLRAGVVFPSLHGHFKSRLFARAKCLLDFQAGLLRSSDQAFLAHVDEVIETALADVAGFSDGIKVDHMIRTIQTCNWGLVERGPSYLPFATGAMTRSIYSLPAGFKQRGALTKALTERLDPALAWIKTQYGVPTVRRTFLRSLYFLPERLATVTKIAKGFRNRVLKTNQTGQSLARHLRLDYSMGVLQTLLNEPPYSEIFRSAESMSTGYLYEPAALNRMLEDARAGRCQPLNLMSRVISQELAYRWVRASHHDRSTGNRRVTREGAEPVLVPPLA